MNLNELIKKYEDTDKNEYIPPREILQDLNQFKETYKEVLNDTGDTALKSFLGE